MDLSVIMSARLSHYAGATKEPERKFHRAIQSFVDSTGDFSSELIIASDGCDKVDEQWRVFRNNLGYGSEASSIEVKPGRLIRHMRFEKTTKWFGAARNAALDTAQGKVAAYLDTDDIVLPRHFADIVSNFGENDWIYFDYLQWPSRKIKTELRVNRCGTCTFAHKPGLPVRWEDAYASDATFIFDLMKLTRNYSYKPIGGYVVCHIPGGIDV